MIRRLTLMLTLVAMVGLIAAPAVGAARHTTGSDLLTSIPVTGALEDGGSFVGDVTIESLELVNGVLMATGSLSGTATDALGNATEIVGQTFTTTLDLLNPDGGKCDILQLNLGPIDLDLLGLVVNLSAIDLNVDAVPGPGNLLGNLLCAVAGLLDGPGIGSALNNLLDRINDLLGGLLG